MSATSAQVLGAVTILNAMPPMLQERAVYYREKANGSYNASAYFWASSTVEIPYVLFSGGFWPSCAGVNQCNRWPWTIFTDCVGAGNRGRAGEGGRCGGQVGLQWHRPPIRPPAFCVCVCVCVCFLLNLTIQVFLTPFLTPYQRRLATQFSAVIFSVVFYWLVGLTTAKFPYFLLMFCTFQLYSTYVNASHAHLSLSFTYCLSVCLLSFTDYLPRNFCNVARYGHRWAGCSHAALPCRRSVPPTDARVLWPPPHPHTVQVLWPGRGRLGAHSPHRPADGPGHHVSPSHAAGARELTQRIYMPDLQHELPMILTVLTVTEACLCTTVFCC